MISKLSQSAYLNGSVSFKNKSNNLSEKGCVCNHYNNFNSIKPGFEANRYLVSFKGVRKTIGKEGLNAEVIIRAEEKAQVVLENATLKTVDGKFLGYKAVGSTDTEHPDYLFLWTRDNIYSLFGDVMAGNTKRAESYIKELSKSVSEEGRVSISINPADGTLITGSTNTIGHIHSIDSTLMFVLLASMVAKVTDNNKFFEEIKTPYIKALKLAMENNKFDPSPLISTNECTTLIDRPLGLHGYVTYNQVLLYGALSEASRLGNQLPEALVGRAATQASQIKDLLNKNFWVDQPSLEKLGEIVSKSAPRLREFEYRNENPFNIKSVKSDQIGDLNKGGYFVAAARTGKLDFRFDSLANLLAIAFGITSKDQTDKILNYMENNGINVPAPSKMMWPVLPEEELQRLVPGDQTTFPHCYHNGGSWPLIGGILVSVLKKAGRHKDAVKHLNSLAEVVKDDMPEWVHGESGKFLKEISNTNQTWSAASYLMGLNVVKNDAAPFFNMK